MPKVKGGYPSLLNGVSQQAQALRLTTQGSSQINFYDTITRGKIKRPPAEFVANLGAIASSVAGTHIIHRDSDEKYVLILAGGVLRVFDFNGVEKTVNAPHGWGYLTGITDGKTQFRALTVADHTFVLNTTKTVTQRADTFPTRPYEALINIFAGNYSRRYSITINGTEYAVYETFDSSVASNEASIRTETIAANLFNDLDAALPAGFNVSLYQSAIHVWSSTDFTISGLDGVNGNAMKISKGQLQRFSDLPNYSAQDFTIEITSTEGIGADNYWVKADKNGDNANSHVVWKECPKPGEFEGFEASTMPHILRRELDGTFTFARADWVDRKCGDIEISPDPSFVGSTISDVFFFKNRLGFLSGENVVLSRAGGNYFDFYRTTATTLLDDDPIDVASGHTKVSTLRASVPYQGILVLFSDETQFRLGGNEILTPKTVNMIPMAEYSSSRFCRPVSVGQSIFFVNDTAATGSHSSIYELIYDRKLDSLQSSEATSHVPNYIPARVRKLIGAETESAIVALTRGSLASMFVYRYYWGSEKKVQESWSEWTLNVTEIFDGVFVDSDIHLLVNKAGYLMLLKFAMDTVAADAPLTFKVGLDFRLKSTSAVYSADTNRTTITVPNLPWGVTPTLVCLTGLPGAQPLPVTVTDLGTGYSTYVVRGNWNGYEFFAGVPYSSLYVLSRPYYRSSGQNGGMTTHEDGRTQVYHMTVTFDTTSYFEVEVDTEGRDPVTHSYTAFEVSSPATTINGAVAVGGSFTFPVQSRNTACTISLKNSTWLPSGFLSAAWVGSYNPSHRGA